MTRIDYSSSGYLGNRTIDLKIKKIKWNNIILHFVYLMIMNETSAPIVAWKCNFSSHPLGKTDQPTNQSTDRPTEACHNILTEITTS